MRSFRALFSSRNCSRFMTLVAIGLNHNTASLAQRERFAFAPEKLLGALRDAQGDGLSEVAILSTCNRTEVYVFGEGGQDRLTEWLSRHHDLSIPELEACCYFYEGERAISHMMTVAGGLDSMVLGEPQILGQMKSAYSVANEAGTIGRYLHSAFHQIFSVAKRIRSETAIGENPVSVAYAAVTLSQQIFSDLSKGTALLLGAGETIELVARHLQVQNIKSLIIANRTLARASDLAEQFDAEAILLADIPDHLHRADIVITSTASQLPLLGKGAVESALKKRRHRPMFMVDIAVPRDIEPEVGELADVYLYSVDDLKEVIDEGMRSRQEAADKAKAIIRSGVEDYLSEQRALDSVATIRAYRQQAESIRDVELSKALKSLETGSDPQQVLSQLARGLTNKLLHHPTTRLKRAGKEGEHHILEITQELFDLDLDQDNKP